MPNRRNIPKDLTSLTEKREADDRRQEERRTGQAEAEIVGDERRTGDDRRQNEDRRTRRGVMLILVAVLMPPLLAMVAFGVDYGYLLKVRMDLQRTADFAALAAVQSLIPAADGTQDLAAVRSTLRTYATSNTDNSFQVLDSDIEIGRYDPATIYSNVTLLNTGTFDAVRVTLRYDSTANSPVTLFFARAIGINNSPVTATATAVLQKGTIMEPGAKILPFSIPLDVWDSRNPGDSWSMYGDGKLADESGATIPGNWGTLDIGDVTNSTSDINDQILNGLHQQDLDFMYADGRIPSNTHIDSTQPAWLNGDPGLSTGMKWGIQPIHGQQRIVPIYDTLGGELKGSHLEFHIVGWGVVTVAGSQWSKGVNNTFVTITKSYAYMGKLRPDSDLTNTTGVIEGAYTSPALVE